MTARPRIVLTREHARNAAWAVRLRAAGHPVLELPLLRFAALPLPADVDPAAHDWILFTSPQGVQAFLDAGLAPGGARCGALGAGTARALASAGLSDDLGVDAPDGAALAAAFAARVAPPARVLLPGPRERRDEPLAVLADAGFTVTALPLYATEAVPAAELPADAPGAGDVVFFCSPSAVRAFTGAWDARPDCVAIGATTAAALREAGFAPRVAAAPNLEAMVRAAGLDPVPAPVPEGG